MANKIPREQADVLIARCVKECSLNGNKLGVTLWKQLTLKQISNIIHPDKEIFYIKDDEKALEMFNLYCVEDGDENS